jgi:hypothetical protein
MITSVKRHFFKLPARAWRLGLVLVVIAATCLVYWWWAQLPRIEYQEIRNYWGQSLYARYLPAALPSTATHIYLNQSEGETIVRYRLPPVEIQSLLRQFPAEPVTQQPTRFLSRNPLAPTFNVYVLEESDPSNWNHPYEYGVAIDATTDEVLYWISTN